MPILRTTALASVLLAGCGESAATRNEPPPQDRPTRVTVVARTDLPLLETDNPRPLVEVEFSGIGKAVWMVDTGAAFSWVSRQFVERHGIERHPLGATLTDIHGEDSGVSERVFIDLVQIGGVKVTNFKPPVFDALYDDIDGSLGQDILRLAFVVIDGPGGTLSLLPKDSDSNVLADFGKVGRRAVGFHLDWSKGVPYFTTQVEGMQAPLSFLVDTGTGPMTLTPEAIDELGLEHARTEESRAISDLPTAPQLREIYSVPRLNLGLFWVDDEAMSTSHASLGWGVLRTMLFAFNNANDTVLLFVE